MKVISWKHFQYLNYQVVGKTVVRCNKKASQSKANCLLANRCWVCGYHGYVGRSPCAFAGVHMWLGRSLVVTW